MIGIMLSHMTILLKILIGAGPVVTLSMLSSISGWYPRVQTKKPVLDWSGAVLCR